MKAFLIGATVGWLTSATVFTVIGTANVGTFIPGLFIMLGWVLYNARQAGGAA